ncbi:D-isomer specific 2-hydroxyacid dehydrogenase NAD-binding [Penicillium maclennaniae]|uniref:D-isomer specific 2-hydroxyacid dehydrogenase NAD-binding n=1 Tax=Penicillium maclennaniae TaxID=1343394 RepID=UPI0025401998|nr:D-isomer specific 2-hydroxyacid dehydrogenase NAD-binding [Penicillium maclennaniae]KAJ5670182.1 D-isomer specific 2-hydroxyacid dehydrogenase NAD-binding [Penicillium maclennaniae]
MRMGFRLMNIARGKLLDESVLIDALKRGQLSAAGLRTSRTLIKSWGKMKMAEILTHNAGISLDLHIGFERLGLENIISFLQNGKAMTPVNQHLLNKALV